MSSPLPFEIPLLYGVSFCPFCGQETSENDTNIWEAANQVEEMRQMLREGLPILHGRVIFDMEGQPISIERRWCASSQLDTCRGGQFTTRHELSEEEKEALSSAAVRQRLLGLQQQLYAKAARRLKQLQNV